MTERVRIGDQFCDATCGFLLGFIGNQMAQYEVCLMKLGGKPHLGRITLPVLAGGDGENVV